MAQQTAARTLRRAHWIGIATALMSALAGGAVWCLLALYARHDLVALSLPIAGVVVWALRSHGYAGRGFGAAIAVACVAMSCAYSLYLQAAAQVASLLGLPLRDALWQMDPHMAIDIARAGLDPVNAVIVGIALAVAGFGMLPTRARSS